MTDLLVTADCHIKTDEAERRLDILRWICSEARSKQVDALVIAGDLFDSPEAGQKLKPDVETIFDDELDNTPVIMIAGNHDENLGELGWMEPVTVLDAGEHHTFQCGDTTLSLYGLPYLRGESFHTPDEYFEPTDADVHCLLGHASFVAPGFENLVEEILAHNEENAFVLHNDDFQDSFFDQILLGHWHDYKNLNGHVPSHYIGAPAPNSTRELGPKSVLDATVEKHGLNLKPVSIPAPPGWFYDRIEIQVVPGHEESALNTLRDKLVTEADGCELIVKITGFSDRDQETLRREFEELARTESETKLDYELDFDVTHAEEFDVPIMQRLLDQLESTEPEKLLSVDSVLSRNEPDEIHDRMLEFITDTDSGLKQRARQLLLESFYSVSES